LSTAEKVEKKIVSLSVFCLEKNFQKNEKNFKKVLTKEK